MKAKKHLGQHFLKDRHIVNRIIDAMEAPEGASVLEIGPGPATLTTPLNQRGYRVRAVDPDQDMITYLQGLEWEPPLDLIHADFLTLPLDRVVQGTTFVVSNLPYNVSVPITARLLEASDQIPTMVLMYQKEVAERIRAPHNTRDYGPISVVCRQFYEVDFHFNVKPGSFQPPPKVMSQVIRLRRRDTFLIPLEALAEMTSLVRYLFLHRRKMIGTRLKKWPESWTNGRHLLESLNACGLDPKSRPEDLTPDDYARWFLLTKGLQ